MNKKGFTLIELLAVITLLGLLATIAVPTIAKIIKDSKDDSQVVQEKTIIKAAKQYFNSPEHYNLLPTDSSSGCVTVSTLKEAGYLPNENIWNTSKGTIMNGKVIVTYAEGKYSYKYATGSSCSSNVTD